MVFLVGIQWVSAVGMILSGIIGLLQTQDTVPAGPAVLMMLIGIVLLPVFNRFITDNKRRAAKYGTVIALIFMVGLLTPKTTEPPTSQAAAPTPSVATVTASPIPSKASAAPTVKTTVAAAKPMPKPTSTPKPVKPTPTVTKVPVVNQAKVLQDQIDALYGQAKAQEGNYQAAAAVYKQAIQLQPNDPVHYYFAGQQYAMLNDNSPDAITLYTQGINVGMKSPQKNADMLGMLYESRANVYKYQRNCQKSEADFREACKHSQYSPSECAERIKIADCRGYLLRSGG